MKKKDTGEKCQSCKKNPAGPEHTCPYQEEINDNTEAKCNCCRECSQECCDDI